MEHWYTVHTKPRNEHVVRDFLQKRGIETYLPLLKVASNRYRQKRQEKPFFARYLFIHTDFAKVPLSSVHWVPGVTRVVSFGGQPAVVQDEVIQWLKDQLARTEARDYYQGLPLRPGDRLRVTMGPLKDMEVIFDRRFSSEDRARVFIEILGRPTACQIDLHCLERIGR